LLCDGSMTASQFNNIDSPINAPEPPQPFPSKGQQLKESLP